MLKWQILRDNGEERKRKEQKILTVSIVIVFIIVGLIFVNTMTSFVILDPQTIGFGGATLDSNYETLLDSLYESGNVTMTINDKLWVPWFSTSVSCGELDLHRGNNCNNNGPINFTHNCMVTDEFSQVGMIVALGKNQQRMNEFYNTVAAINSTFGKLPSWKVYRNGDVLEPCKAGINSNCDTATDADARIIIALYTASNNSYFSDQIQKNLYRDLANDLARDFVRYDVLYECKPSSLGQGDICYWMAAGANSQTGGLGSNNFAYTGYYSDAIIAMLQTCSQTGNMTYCSVARNLTLNFLQASNFNGNNFTVPPGKSFKWVNLGGVPVAECTSECSPPAWDEADAPRALGICQANYYAELINQTLPLLPTYCNIWGSLYLNSPNQAIYRYYPDGAPTSSYVNSYFAQGLQSLFQFGSQNSTLVGLTLLNALEHYNPVTKVWDGDSCFGVYHQTFAIRALGSSIGRDDLGFPAFSFGESNNASNSVGESSIGGSSGGSSGEGSGGGGGSGGRSNSPNVGNTTSENPTIVNGTIGGSELDGSNKEEKIKEQTASGEFISGNVVSGKAIESLNKKLILLVSFAFLGILGIFFIVRLRKRILFRKEIERFRNFNYQPMKEDD